MSLSKPSASDDIGVLPLDTLRDILLRLQAKELCRLRLVCRRWRSLLSDPRFAAAHHTRHQPVLIIAGYNDDTGRDVLVDIMDLSGQIVKKVHRMEGDRAVSVSLDHICVSKIDDSCTSYRLFNRICEELYYLPYKVLDPATGAVYHIPDSYAEEHVELASIVITEPKYLFGQVARTGEYKIFRMLFHFPTEVGRRQMFEVCTLSANDSSSCARWRRVVPLEGIEIGSFTSVVINGVVYCLCYHPPHSTTFSNQVSEKDLIFTFDLETEAWGPSIRGPPITFPDDDDLVLRSLGLPTVRQLTIANLNHSLAVVHGPAPNIDIWILLDLANGLWIKTYSIQFEEYNNGQLVHPLFVFADGRIILYKQDHEYLQIYDPITNTLTNSVESKHFSAVDRYTGNLLSLKC